MRQPVPICPTVLRFAGRSCVAFDARSGILHNNRADRASAQETISRRVPTVIMAIRQPLSIADRASCRPAFLAPMSGVTERAFRDLAHELGAGLVVSEMVASRELVRGARKALAKAERGRATPFVMQLAGREAQWMAEGARIAEAAGAEIIDINMGCPAREVTGMLSGSALMRDLDHALGIIEAVVGAVRVPVTLKMRLGWDDETRNAPELARRAEQAGVAMVTVHGRTRCQFYKGHANWSAVRHVKDVVGIPVVVNGDIIDPATAMSALELSGADAVMIGRGAYGAPWMPGRIATALTTGRDPGDPTLADQGRLAVRLVDRLASDGPDDAGLKRARKHIAWSLARLVPALGAGRIAEARRNLCTETCAATVIAGLGALFDAASDAAASQAGAVRAANGREPQLADVA